MSLLVRSCSEVGTGLRAVGLCERVVSADAALSEKSPYLGGVRVRLGNGYGRLSNTPRRRAGEVGQWVWPSFQYTSEACGWGWAMAMGAFPIHRGGVRVGLGFWEVCLSRTSRTRQALPSSSNHPSVSSGVTDPHHLVAVTSSLSH